MRERTSHGLHFRFCGVIEMPARAKDLHALEARLGNLLQVFGPQFSRYENVR